MISGMMLFLTELPPDRVFGIDSQLLMQMGAHLINISLLALVLSHFLYKPVKKFMQNRSNQISSQLDNAKDELEKSTALKQEYEQKMKSIEAERDEILIAARKEATEASKLTLADAKREADEIVARAKANIELEWERNRAQMRLEIINVSVDMTEKYLKQTINKQTLDRLFDETMEELGEMVWRN